MSVLVTGGAGFIGSHVCAGLLARGDEVVALDNLSTGSPENVPEGAELVVTDVADEGAVRDVLARGGFEAVLHVAGQASVDRSFERPERDLRTNVVGTLKVIEACIEARVPRLVYASSMTVYGEPERVPTPENAPPMPVSYYGVTKLAGEQYVHIAGARPDVDLSVTSLRMFNVYGERQSVTNPYQGVLAIFMGNVLRGEPITIHSDGAQTRDFVYVADVVEAWMRILDNDNTRNSVFNVGSGRETSVAELAHAVLRAFGHDPAEWELRSAPAQRGDVRHSLADVASLKAATGWRPTTELGSGMARTVAWAIDAA